VTCDRNSLVGLTLGEFCPSCRHCVGVHDQDGLCAACLVLDISVARMQPGDVVVYRSRDRLNYNRSRAIHDQLHALFPDHEVAICEAGDAIEIVRGR
jgi:hypothetical protein